MVDRHYPRAPITEALIDLQVEFASAPSAEEFGVPDSFLPNEFQWIA
jgi:hypothetical protein